MPRTNVNQCQAQYRRFNDWVRGELKLRHDSQENLAQYLNLNRKSLYKRLSGKVEWTFKEVLNTAEYFGVDIAEII